MEEFTFADFLRQYRHRSNYIQRDLAEELGIALGTLKNWESGYGLPRYRKDVLKIEDILRLSPFEINSLLKAANFEPKYALEIPKSNFVPFQLPPRAEYFSGRQDEIIMLSNMLLAGRNITLCGAGGMGKTALGAEAIFKLAEIGVLNKRFPNGVIFYSFYGRASTELALEHIVKSLHETEQNYSSNAVRRLLSGKHLLIFLDGAENADDFNEILEVISKSCCILVTSRSRDDAKEIRIDVNVLSEDESVGLLRSWCLTQIDSELAAKQICNLVGHLPLALRLVGRYLSNTEELASEFVVWLQQSPFQALEIGGSRGREQSVSRLLEKSLLQIGVGAQKAMSIIGLLSLAPFNRQVVEVVLGGIEGKLSLNQLVMYGLLHRRSEQNYEVSHALVHTYAKELSGDSLEYLDRLANYFIEFVAVQVKQGVQGFVILDGTRSHILAILLRLKDQELWHLAKDIVFQFANYFHVRGYWADYLTILEIGLIAVRNLKLPREEGIFLGKLGITYQSLGQYKKAKAYHQQAIDIYREIDDRKGEADELGSLGEGYRLSGQTETAIKHHDQALAIHQEINNRQGIAQQLSALGNAYLILGKIDIAKGKFENALLLRREVGDRFGESDDLGHLGKVYSELSENKRAIENYKEALSIAREIGDRHGECNHLGSLGAVYSDIGQIEDAINYYQQALTMANAIGFRKGQSSFLGNLGIEYKNLGQIERAIACYKEAISIAHEIGFRLGESNHLNNLGVAYSNLGQSDEAVLCYKEALVIAREVGFRRGESGLLGNLGKEYKHLGQIEQAVDYYNQALVITREIGYRLGESNHLNNLGIVYSDIGQADKAIINFNMSLTIVREIGYRLGESYRLGNLGKEYKYLGQIEQAIDYFNQSLLIAHEIGFRKGECDQLGNLGLAYVDIGQVEQAIEYFEKSLSIARVIRYRTGESDILGYLGAIYYKKSWIDKAITNCQESLAIAREISYRLGEGTQLKQLGEIYAQLGETDLAIQFCEQALLILEKIKPQDSMKLSKLLKQLKNP